MTDYHEIPVLNTPSVTEDDFESFAEHLAFYVCQWIPEIAVPVMRSADKLFEMPAFRLLLDKWYEVRRSDLKGQRERLMRAATHTECSWECEGESEEFDGNLYTDEARELSEALRTLLVG